MGKKRKKIWKFIPLCIFWMVWKERNRLAFRGGSLAVQKLKNSFVCNLWSWARLFIRDQKKKNLLLMDFSFIMPYPNTHAHLDAFLAES